MKSDLQGWMLTEGMYDMMETRDPAVSAVITALEAIRPEVGNPFIVLQAPESDDSYPNYCQAFADEGGYVSEIRFFSGTDFTHHRGFLPDAEGGVCKDEAELPNLTQMIQILIAFIADPSALPVVEGVEWLDVSDEFEPVWD